MDGYQLNAVVIVTTGDDFFFIDADFSINEFIDSKATKQLSVFHPR